MPFIQQYLPYLIVLTGTGIMLILVRTVIIANLSGKTQQAPKSRLKKALALSSSGDYAAAADIYRDLGNIDKAVELYINAKAFVPAAELLQRLQRSRDASALLVRSGDFAAAAAMLAKMGDYPYAAENFIKTGDNLRAAEMLEKSHDYIKAAQYYEQAHDYRKAAEMYANTKDFGEAGRMMELCYKDEKSRLSDTPSTRALSNLGYWAGSFYRSAHKFDLAAALFSQEKYHNEAAECFTQIGDWQRASTEFRAAGDTFKAAEALEKVGAGDQSSLLKAQALQEAGKPSEAADYYAAAGQLQKAAELKESAGEFLQSASFYEQAEIFENAAINYQKADQLLRAAELFKRADNLPKATELFLAAGELEQAYALYADQGLFFDAGSGFFNLGQIDHALKLLQSVEKNDPQYVQALNLTAEIFIKKNILPTAREKLEEAIGGKPIEKQTLQPYYNLSLVYERSGNKHQALQVLDKIIGINYNFLDSADRAAKLRTEISMATTEPDRPKPQQPAATPSGQSGFATPPAVANIMTSPTVITPSQVNEQRYKIIQKIGQGGAGVVYKALDTFLDRTVAYKVLTSGGQAAAKEEDNFKREAKAAASLNHPNIVTVYDAGINNDQYFITMEYIEGPNLQQLVEEHGALPVSAILLMMGQVCKALDHAHSHMIVHRDIKTSNILWKDQKVVKIVDFGLAKFLQDLRNLQTVWGGTPYFMSPEQILGEQIDHRTDIYSFGVSMFQLITGRLPFTDGDVGYHHVHNAPPNPLDFRSDIPAKLAEITLHCLEKAPASRYQSMLEIFDDLKSLNQ
jgi:eukaryotic-like serine/threonine-protein kinase